MRLLPRVLRRLGSTKARADDLAPSQHLLYQVWGANTDVGKTILSAGLLRAVGETALYVKPVQTGPPDHTLVQNVAKHAKTSTLVSLDAPLSPDLAAELSGIPPVDDADVEHRILSTICRFEQLLVSEKLTGPAFGVLESAGGVLSPMPSGSAQADFYRKFRLPSMLVGDARLGGISTTLASYEALRLRGYDVPTVVVFPQHGAATENEVAIERGVDTDCTTVLRAPDLPPNDVSLKEYFETDEAASFFSSFWNHLRVKHADYIQKIHDMQKNAPEILWYPFTQHENLGNIVCIDSAYDDKYRIYDNDREAFADISDAFCSWWTTGAGHGDPNIAKAVAHAAGRYGHVGLPSMAHEGAYELARRLLDGVGKGWADRVFYSDNGSTAVEVGLKMALRKRNIDRPDKKHLEQRIIGLEGCYHGDTLGAMDCAASSDYNSRQTPWYKPRGLFFDPPAVAIVDGVWSLRNIPEDVMVQSKIFASRDLIYDAARDGSEYDSYIEQTIDTYLAANKEVDLAALLLEPVMLGAGGMRLVDPAFQRALVRVARHRQMQVIFDEVFSGLWRLGVESGASLLAVKPDIACYAKTLTGGAVPLAVTLASSQVYDAFLGSSARDALLHGHSYTAHPVGCAAALAALRLYGTLERTPRTYWDDAMCRELSCAPGVVAVSTLGTVLAVELVERGGSGYAATGSVTFAKRLLDEGVLTRPLGNILYVMVPPLADSPQCRTVADALYRVILEGSLSEVDATA